MSREFIKYTVLLVDNRCVRLPPNEVFHYSVVHSYYHPGKLIVPASSAYFRERVKHAASIALLILYFSYFCRTFLQWERGCSSHEADGGDIDYVACHAEFFRRTDLRSLLVTVPWGSL